MGKRENRLLGRQSLADSASRAYPEPISRETPVKVVACMVLPKVATIVVGTVVRPRVYLVPLSCVSALAKTLDRKEIDWSRTLRSVPHTLAMESPLEVFDEIWQAVVQEAVPVPSQLESRELRLQRHFLGTDHTTDEHWQLGSNTVDLDIVQARSRCQAGEH